jgi:hypothetical protein
MAAKSAAYYPKSSSPVLLDAFHIPSRSDQRLPALAYLLAGKWLSLSVFPLP